MLGEKGEKEKRKRRKSKRRSEVGVSQGKGGDIGVGGWGRERAEATQGKHYLLTLPGNETSQKADRMTNRQRESKRGQRLGGKRG